MLMTTPSVPRYTLRELDGATRALVRLSAVIAVGTEQDIRDEMMSFHGTVSPVWVEELLLQTYLFAGFPRALNAMREWRRLEPELAVSGAPVSGTAVSGTAGVDVRRAGADVCAEVYGSMYERLRDNIRALHPLLDEWMISEGYGKVLARPELDLARRELCIVAACGAQGQDRQLHSHLHGAINVGVAPAVVSASIEAIADVLGADRAHSMRLLWARVQGK
jgi:4-carboxymuconolactone decarboxylase